MTFAELVRFLRTTLAPEELARREAYHLAKATAYWHAQWGQR